MSHFGWGHDRGLRVEGTREAWATLSPDGAYRYALGRNWDTPPDDFAPSRPVMVWVMLNPSTADHRVDDPTIRKCIGFAKRHQCGGIRVVNLFAFRATDPRELAKASDPVGPRNLYALDWALGLFFSLYVLGWGRFPSARVRRLAIEPMCYAKIRPGHAFGTTKDGQPRHPLMLGYNTPLCAPGRWT